MRKQFDLDYYLAHPEVKVVTRDGMDARVICTDAENNHPIVALVNRENGSFTFLTNEEGSLSDMYMSEYDLFFDLPEPEKKKVPLTYDDLLERIKAGKTMWVQGSSNCSLISYFNKVDDVCFGDLIYTTKDLINDTFTDGSPCWKEVEE